MHSNNSFGLFNYNSHELRFTILIINNGFSLGTLNFYFKTRYTVGVDM